MRKKILLLQFRKKQKPLKQETEIFKKKMPGVKVMPFNTAKNHRRLANFPLENFNAIIMGGSGDFNLSDFKNKKKDPFWLMIKNTISFLKRVQKRKIPVLGICFGHQILGYLLGSKVIHDAKQIEVGSFKLSLTKSGRKDPIFAGLPRSFTIQEGHKNSLEPLPKGARLLASTKNCPISAFRYGKNIYGLQFHPELNKKDMLVRLMNYPKYLDLINVRKNKSLENFLKSSPETILILRNFLKLIGN